MAVMMGRLYAALREANVTDEKATAAAEEVASFENRIGEIRADVGLLKWMVGAVVTLQIMTLAGLLSLLWKVFPAGGP